jgi:hypothetical protein
LTAQSQCWRVDIINTTTTYSSDNTYSNSTLTPGANNNGEFTDGFNFVSSTYSGPPIFEFGIYKVTNNRNGFYFYLDYRDDRYCTTGTLIDIWIKYDAAAGTWQYRNEPEGGTIQKLGII